MILLPSKNYKFLLNPFLQMAHNFDILKVITILTNFLNAFHLCSSSFPLKNSECKFNSVSSINWSQNNFYALRARMYP